MRGKRPLRFVLGILALEILGGCADARFDAANSRRQRNIENVLTTYTKREQVHPKQLRQTLDYAQASEPFHARRLEQSVGGLSQAYRREVQIWPQRVGQTESWVDRLTRGSPERIADTAARMFY